MDVNVLELARIGKKHYKNSYMFRQWLKHTVELYRSNKHVLCGGRTAWK